MIDLLIWGASFVVAILLAFPPAILRNRWRYILTATLFIASQFYLQWAVFTMLSSPTFDDSAGAIFASPLMLFPTLLLLFLGAIRLAWFVISRLAQPDAASNAPPRRR
jgi:hypothetical protein